MGKKRKEEGKEMEEGSWLETRTISEEMSR